MGFKANDGTFFETIEERKQYNFELEQIICLDDDFQITSSPDCATFYYAKNEIGAELLGRDFCVENIKPKKIFAFDESDDDYREINRIITKVKKDKDYIKYSENALGFYIKGKAKMLELLK